METLDFLYFPALRAVYTTTLGAKMAQVGATSSGIPFKIDKWWSIMG